MQIVAEKFLANAIFGGKKSRKKVLGKRLEVLSKSIHVTVGNYSAFSYSSLNSLIFSFDMFSSRFCGCRPQLFNNHHAIIRFGGRCLPFFNVLTINSS